MRAMWEKKGTFDFEEHNTAFLLIFSILAILFFAFGAYMLSGTGAFEKAIGYASCTAGVISLIVFIYTIAIRFLRQQIVPEIEKLQEWTKKEIKKPIILTIYASSGKKPEEIRNNLKEVEAEIEKEKEFWDKFF